MAYLTDRKRAEGLGSAKEGTHHHWLMMVSSASLAVLTPFFLFTFAPMLGKPHGEVLAYFSQPFPAIIAALMIVATFLHFKNGVQALIEDYIHGTARKVTLIAMTCLSYAAAATGLFAIARMAL